jgi:hypothetical protein
MHRRGIYDGTRVSRAERGTGISRCLLLIGPMLLTAYAVAQEAIVLASQPKFWCSCQTFGQSLRGGPQTKMSG